MTDTPPTTHRCKHCGWDGEALAAMITTTLNRLDLMLWEMEAEER